MTLAIGNSGGLAADETADSNLVSERATRRLHDAASTAPARQTTVPNQGAICSISSQLRRRGLNIGGPFRVQSLAVLIRADFILIVLPPNKRYVLVHLLSPQAVEAATHDAVDAASTAPVRQFVAMLA